jgi:hypothetical protein
MFMKRNEWKRERKQGKHQCLPDTHFKSMLRPWLPKCNRSLEPFPNPDPLLYFCRQLLHSPALGEIAVRDYDRVSFWRMSHGGKAIKFVARIQVHGARSVCYAGTCLLLFRQNGREKQVTMMCRHDGAFQDFYSVRVQQSTIDIEGHGDLLALSSHSAATVYQQRAVREFVVLYRIAIGQSVLVFIPFVCFVRGWQTTVCKGFRDAWDDGSRKSVLVFEIYRTWSCTNGFDTARSRDYVEESPRRFEYFTKRHVVWVHDCMGVLSVLDVEMQAAWRPRFMFSCDSDQYAFTRNVSDVKQAWMCACVQ